MTLPIRWKLTIWYSLLVSVTFLAAAGGIYLGLLTAIRHNIDRELNLRLEGVRVFLDRESSLKPAALSEELTAHAGVRLNGDVYQLSLPDGSWVYRPASIEPLQLAHESFSSLDAPRFSQMDRQGKQYRTLTAKLPSGEHIYEVQLLSNVTPVFAILHGFLLVSFAVAPIVVAIAAFGGYWLSGRAMRPVRDIILASQEIRENNLNQRLPVSAAKDELRDLANTVNSMLDRLEVAFRRITQFTADASHELRTPIAVIRTTAEVALASDRSAREHRDFLQEIIRETTTTAALLENMLVLARTDAAAGNQSVRRRVDMRSLLSSVEPGFCRMAESKGLRFSCSAGVFPLLIEGDHAALRQLLLIFVDNAMKYTTAPGLVEVSITRTDGEVCLQVRDTGCGIAPVDLPHIFERFYRSAQARSEDESGSGLGLAIAKSIVTAHAGVLDARSELGRGSAFSVSFPALEH